MLHATFGSPCERIPVRTALARGRVRRACAGQLLVLALWAPTTLRAAPSWREAACDELKLYGRVLIGDERGNFWDDRLPEGWRWMGPEHTPVPDPGKGFLNCAQLSPVVEGGKIVFKTSKWNFLPMALDAGITEEELGRKVAALASAKTFRFASSKGIAAAQAAFEKLDPAAAAKALDAEAREMAVPNPGYGVLVVRTRVGRLFKVLVEHYVMTAALTWSRAEGKGPERKFGAPTVIAVLRRPWTIRGQAARGSKGSRAARGSKGSRDLDGDGQPDLGWSKDSPAYKPLDGASLNLVAVFPYP